jgi:uncharacterized protein (TIGR02391 family)
MILTDEEMQQVRRSIEAQAGLDEELVRRCGHLIHLGAFDEAVRSAFVLLEERLRKAVNEEGMTGTQLANYAFNPTKGALAKHLGRNQSEREGLRELYSGAFRLFRNPTAHGVTGYSAAEGKAIIGLVDLMLKMLKRAEELPPPDLFPENVETALSKIEETIGPGATSRLRMFLGKCLKEIGLKPSASAKQWIAFRRYALYKPDHWDEPRSHSIAVFYLVATGPEYSLYFSTNYYYANVVGFNVDRLIEELTELGFRLRGKNQEPRVELRMHNDQIFFDELFNLVARTADELEETLQQKW